MRNAENPLSTRHIELQGIFHSDQYELVSDFTLFKNQGHTVNSTVNICIIFIEGP